MKEILDDLDRWRQAGQAGGAGPGGRHRGLRAPRCPGAAMAVNEDGEVAGSVSGGCVEGAVVTEALDILADRRPAAVSPSATATTRPSPSASPAAAPIHLFIEPLDW